MTTKGLLLALLLIFPLSALILSDIVVDLYALGKSKTRRRKDRKEISVWQKLLLTEYVRRCKYYQKRAKRFLWLYWFYIVCTVVALLLYLLAMGLPALEPLFRCCAVIRVLLLDVFIGSYRFVMTRYDKNYHIRWRWHDD